MMSLEGAGTPSNLGSAESDILNPGQTFDAYKVMRCLYFSPLGGFYLLNNIQSGELCSAYIFPGAVSQDPQFSSRFHEYSTRIATLEHQNILKARNPDVISSRYCLFFDPIEGNTVEAYLEELASEKLDADRIAKQTKQPFRPSRPEEGPVAVAGAGLSPERTRNIAQQTCQALKYAHEQGLHHYSLSCHNLILGLQDSIKVWGIGIYEMLGDELFQRLISQGVPPLKSNQRKRVVNPVEILPPEVRRGAAHDARSDIYSMGYCGYQMLTGLKVGPNFQLPSQVVPTIPQVWDGIVTKCLDPDNTHRFQTLSLLLTQLESMAPPSSKAKDTATATPASKGAMATINKGLDVIPLPGKMREKAKPTQILAFRLAILGVLGAIVVGIGAFLYPQLVSDDGLADEGPKVLRTASGSKPRLTLNVNVSKCRAVFSGKGTGTVVTTNGVIEASMPPGEYTVTIEATNYSPAKVSVIIGTTPIEMPIHLEPNYGLLQVKAMPGARLYSVGSNGNRRFVGMVGSTGEENFSSRLFARKYDFEISAPGYAPSVFPGVSLGSNKPTVLNADLVALPGTIRVLTEPAGAQILMQVGDEEPVERGATPLEITDVPVQTPIVFTAVHPLYKTRSLAYSLRPGQKESLDFGVLQRKVGKLVPQITLNGAKPTEGDLKKLSLKIDETLFTIKGGIMENVPAGPIKIQVEHPDYLPWQANANMPEDQTLTFTANLEPRPARVSIVLPQAIAYEFFSDGVLLSGTDNTFEVPAGTNRQLEVRIKDHLSVRATLNLGPNEKRDLPVVLKRIPPPETGKNYTVAYVDINMVWAPAGTFMMGTPLAEQGRLPNEGDSNNRQVEVTFTRGFWVGQYEVTQVQYLYIMGNNPSEFKNRPTDAGQVRPVERVSWHDAVAFAEQLTQIERAAGRIPDGYSYRLPTQAEWEYACRAGTNTPFHWGSEANTSNGNFKGVYPRVIGSTNVDDGYSGTAPVGSYKPNAWGLYDMHGNVKEWCLDPYTERFPAGPLVDWAGESSGQQTRPIRGGGWDDLAIKTRAGARDRLAPSSRANSVGFRLVLAPDLGSR